MTGTKKRFHFFQSSSSRKSNVQNDLASLSAGNDDERSIEGSFSECNDAGADNEEDTQPDAE